MEGVMTRVLRSVSWLVNNLYNDTKLLKDLQKFAFSLSAATFMFLMTPDVGRFIGSYEFGEELMKTISVGIGGPLSYLYTIVFNIFEVMMYMETYGDMMKSQGLYWNFVALRLYAAAGHFVYMGIHMYAWKKARSNPKWTEKIVIVGAGFTTALYLHFGHNEIWGDWVSQTIFGIH